MIEDHFEKVNKQILNVMAIYRKSLLKVRKALFSQNNTSSSKLHILICNKQCIYVLEQTFSVSVPVEMHFIIK